MKQSRAFLILLAVCYVLSGFGQRAKQANCFSLLAGREATVDGSVLLAHNEDDWGDLYVDWHKVERKQHPAESFVSLEHGGQVPQVRETWSFLWLQMPGMQFSDSYLNEWGVAIASNQCRSREDQAELESGGIGYFLRRLMAERAMTARQAVKIGGALIEQFGYHYSGRTYLIADPNEAWMMAVVKGKHWVAQRVPDDQVAIIPNYYTIQEIDLRDTVNFLGASDIIRYATDRGWFDPAKGKRFNFREAYADPETLHGIWNIPRHRSAINLLAEKTYGYYEGFPFSFKPAQSVSHARIMDLLANHSEGTEFQVHPGFNHGNPHGNEVKQVCSEGNQYGIVAQLRRDMPAPIAHVLWLAAKRPCIQPFTPWYIGITEIPEAYTRGNPEKCLETHFTDTDLKEKTRDKAYWTFKAYADACDASYDSLSAPMKKFKINVEKNILEQQATMEVLIADFHKTDPETAINLLNQYTGNLAKQVLAFTRAQISGKGK